MASGIYVVEPQTSYKHTHTVLFLHGRDSTNEEFANELFESEASVGRCSVKQELRTLPALFPTIKWVFPAAPLLRSERFGSVMSQWFDIWSVENPEERHELQMPGLKQSITQVLKVIQGEEALVPRQNIFLAGISQGFATALATFFADGHGFAGLIGLCGWIPCASLVDLIPVSESEETVLRKLRAIFATEISMDSAAVPESLKSTPIFLGHALDDEVVPIDNGKRMRDVLAERLQLTVDFHEYPEGGHWLNEPQGVDDLVEFITKHM